MLARGHLKKNPLMMGYLRLLGGKGLATHLLLNNTKAGVDPLSEDNVIIFATGPVTDTKVFGSFHKSHSRFSVRFNLSISPLASGVF